MDTNSKTSVETGGINYRVNNGTGVSLGESKNDAPVMNLSIEGATNFAEALVKAANAEGKDTKVVFDIAPQGTTVAAVIVEGKNCYLLLTSETASKKFLLIDGGTKYAFDDISMMEAIARMGQSVSGAVESAVARTKYWSMATYGVEASFDPRNGEFYMVMRESHLASVTVPTSMYAKMALALRYDSSGGFFFTDENKGFGIFVDSDSDTVMVNVVDGLSTPWVVLKKGSLAHVDFLKVMENAVDDLA